LLKDVEGASDRVLENVANGAFEIAFRLSDSSGTIRALLRRYRNVPMSFADACLVQLATDLETGDVLTLDRDFQVYRWGKNKTFRNLIPTGSH
jgi:uncharacterized protein